MSPAFRLKMAKQKAEALVDEWKLASFAIDPFAIASQHDIEVKAKPDTVDGVSGMLLRHGNMFGIMYATHIDNEGFQRFSVAHELGHYFLDGHVDHILPKDGTHVSHAGFTSGDPYEMEADQFAAGLLMPSKLFKSALGKRDAGLAMVEEMAQMCRTSLTATGIRCAELSSDALAVIISTGGTIDFCFLSNAMKTLPQLSWLKKGTPIPSQTLTARFNSDHARVASGERAAQEIDVMDWLGGNRSTLVTEEVVGLGKYGKTLTVLSSKSIGQETHDDDESEDQSLDESWSVHFRR